MSQFVKLTGVTSGAYLGDFRMENGDLIELVGEDEIVTQLSKGESIDVTGLWNEEDILELMNSLNNKFGLTLTRDNMDDAGYKRKK